MKREELIAKGLTEEQAKAVMDIYTEEMKVFVPKDRLDEVSGKLKEANATIDTLKKDNADNAELQKQVSEYKDKVAQLETSAANVQKTYALRDKLKEAGVTDADYIIYKQGGLEKFSFDKEGNPIGVDDILKPLRESSPHLFKADGRGGYDPAGGSNPPASNPFAKDTWNLTEQGKLFRADPVQARQLAAAAGVKL